MNNKKIALKLNIWSKSIHTLKKPSLLSHQIFISLSISKSPLTLFALSDGLLRCLSIMKVFYNAAQKRDLACNFNCNNNQSESQFLLYYIFVCFLKLIFSSNVNVVVRAECNELSNN